MTAGLSAALREGTRKAHSLAEGMEFVRGFLRGVLDAERYVRLLSAYEAFYGALEEALRSTAGEPRLRGLHFAELERLPAIRADLAFFHRRDGLAARPPSPAAARYVARIAAVAAAEPHLLAAHAYVRYLGDLSGGQILKEIARRSLGLAGRGGTEFYEFDAVADPKAFKQAYRAALDALPLSPAEQAAVVAEANHAFRLNMGVFAELEGSALTALRRSLFPAKVA